MVTVDDENSALRQYCHRVAFTEFDNNFYETLFLMMMMTVMMRIWI